MRFDIITLFPELIAPYFVAGINRRAYKTDDNPTGTIEAKLWQLRDFATGSYKRVDDRPFGGGPGMVMMAEPLQACLDAIRADGQAPCPVVLFSPIGQKLNQALVESWASPQAASEKANGAVLICGRYEGVDQRFIDKHVTHQISLGDFVLSGGEVAAVAFLDAIARLQDGVLGDADSHKEDSFNPHIDGLLDCGHYTRPELWEGMDVPEVLMSGNHKKIAVWRHAERLRLTKQLRPDLLIKL